MDDQLSPDGNYRWDGVAWQPTAGPTWEATDAPTKQEQSIAGKVIIGLAVAFGLCLILAVIASIVAPIKTTVSPVAAPVTTTTAAPTTTTTKPPTTTTTAPPTKQERFYDALRDKGLSRFVGPEAITVVETLCTNIDDMGVDQAMTVTALAMVKADMSKSDSEAVVKVLGAGVPIYCLQHIAAITEWSNR